MKLGDKAIQNNVVEMKAVLSICMYVCILLNMLVFHRKNDEE